MMMNIVDAIRKFGRISPSALAFIEVRPVTGSREEMTWAQFEERTERLARALVERGVQKHSKVFLLGRNSLRWLEAYFAILKTGAWAVPLNFRFTDEDIKHCAKVAEPFIFIFDREYEKRMEGLRAELSTVKHYIAIGSDKPEGVQSLEQIIEETAPSTVHVTLSDEDECALYFTSGTTGTPKPVLLCHKNLMGVAITEASNHNFVDTDRFLMMPPLYHLAIGHLLGGMVAGACSVLLTEQISPQNIIETIARERVSSVFLLVPWTADLLDALDRKQIRIGEYDLSCWREAFMGAQPIPPSLVHRLKGYFPDMQYETTYGLSESSGPGVIHLGIQNERKVGAIGKPGLLWDARIVDATGEDVRRGEVGEVILRGAGVMKEYYRNPELTAQVIKDGWLYTGDLGRFDEEGFIYLVDRKKDLVISGGENVYPVEVEEVIRRHQKVHDVAVIGTPDERLGEIVTAVIQARSGEVLDEEEITRFCEANLPRYKRPRRIVFADVPRNPAGKIEKPKLRELYR
jgi:long-chain acyl-CoA synthetase